MGKNTVFHAFRVRSLHINCEGFLLLDCFVGEQRACELQKINARLAWIRKTAWRSRGDTKN